MVVGKEIRSYLDQTNDNNCKCINVVDDIQNQDMKITVNVSHDGAKEMGRKDPKDIKRSQNSKQMCQRDKNEQTTCFKNSDANKNNSKDKGIDLHNEVKNKKNTYADIVRMNKQKEELSAETTDGKRKISRRYNKINTKGTDLKNEVHALKS